MNIALTALDTASRNQHLLYRKLKTDELEEVDEITPETNYLRTEKVMMQRRGLRYPPTTQVAISQGLGYQEVKGSPSSNHKVLEGAVGCWIHAAELVGQAIEAHTVGGGWIPKELHQCYYVKLQQVKWQAY